MTDDGVTKDDVKVPEGEIGERINKLFKVEEKDTSKYHRLLESSMGLLPYTESANSSAQTLLS
jgi:hypothetical protein